MMKLRRYDFDYKLPLFSEKVLQFDSFIQLWCSRFFADKYLAEFCFFYVFQYHKVEKNSVV